ncbi:MAG: hypothetical protein AABW87_02410 [Nanoarchaeota archaeon]
MLFEKQEVKHIVIAALVLGFVFGFDDGREYFNILPWLSNYLKVAVMSGLALSIYLIAQKTLALRIGGNVEFRIWRIKRYGIFAGSVLKPKNIFGIKYIPLGVIIPLFVAIYSLGKAPFAIVGSSFASVNESLRLGKKFPGLSDFETGKILLAGPLILTILALILKSIEPSPLSILLTKICLALAISNMLPLPNVDGVRVMFSSLPLYIFGLGFILASAYMVFYIDVMTTIILSLILALILLFLYMYYVALRD